MIAACAPTVATDAGSDASIERSCVELPLTGCSVPAAQTGPLRFERCVLDGDYRGEGVGAFDVSGDGLPDVVTDQSWYQSPCMAPHVIRERETWSPFGEYALGFGAHPMDVDRDGCTDVVVPPIPGRPLYWYEHPCAAAPAIADGAWERHEAQPAGTVGLETPFLVDVYGDGRPVVISSDYPAGTFGLLAPGDDPRALWTLQSLAPPGFVGAGLFQHGAGVGDLDGDGDLDVVTSRGWFESPGDREATWTAHVSPDPFGDVGNRCSDMASLDVDGDGLIDVLCASPHETGMSWLQQQPGLPRTFVEHEVPAAASVGEMHALRLADLDGDGDDEIISGTRWCAHCGPGDTDDPFPELLVYFTVERGDDGPTFTMHTMDDASGIGVAFDVADVDGDGDLDVVTMNKHGTFYFRRVD